MIIHHKRFHFLISKPIHSGNIYFLCTKESVGSWNSLFILMESIPLCLIIIHIDTDLYLCESILLCFYHVEGPIYNTKFF
jgi:hypothetical protein